MSEEPSGSSREGEAGRRRVKRRVRVRQKHGHVTLRQKVKKLAAGNGGWLVTAVLLILGLVGIWVALVVFVGE